MKRTAAFLCALAGASLVLSSCCENPLDWLNGGKNANVPKAAISGEVYVGRNILSSDGQADPSGIKVSIAGTSLSALTDAKGMWRIENVPQGTHDILFSREDLFPVEVNEYQFLGDQDVSLRKILMSTPPSYSLSDLRFSDRPNGSGQLDFWVTLSPVKPDELTTVIVFFGKDRNVSHVPGTYSTHIELPNQVNQTGSTITATRSYFVPSYYRSYFQPGEKVYAVAYPLPSYRDYGLLPHLCPRLFEKLGQGKSNVADFVMN